MVSWLVAYDGAQRVRHSEPPLEALQRGPVWVINTIHGNLDYAAPHASLANKDEEDVLVFYDDRRLLGTIEARAISLYETVTVLDPGYKRPNGIPLWRSLATGDQVTLVHAYTGDFH